MLSAEVYQEDVKLNEDRPENILIEGNYGSGKSGLGVILLEELMTMNTMVYSNSRLKENGFSHMTEYTLIPNVSYNHLLNFKIDSIAYISEIHKLFDRRESMKSKNILATQAIQEIRKCKYKIIADCQTAILLDFRYLRTVTDIIRAYGNIERIIEDELLNDIVKDSFLKFFGLLNEKNYKFIFLYELRKYSIELDEVFPTGKFFIYDIRDSFNKYFTHERIQKRMSLLNYL